jgi:hypothetical protein
MGEELRPFGEAGVSTDNRAILHFRQTVAMGKHWYIALLESIGLWAVPGESYNGRDYSYLIGGEAFDWMLLAERILDEVGDLVPRREAEEFLFHGRPPVEITKDEFQEIVGEAKYRAYLNYFYGITVEEALLLSAEGEARKEHLSCPYNGNSGTGDEAYVRIYGATSDELLKRFRKENGLPRRKSMELGELKEFTYWLFKYRLGNSDKARIASDTKKALEELGRQRGFSDRCWEPT